MKKSITAGIVGAGRIGMIHAKSISSDMQGVHIKTVADPYASKEAVEAMKQWGVESIVKEYKEIIADPEIDAVLICSSTPTHAAITQDAARAGKHVFCEKPIDFDIENIRQTLEVVESTGIKFQVGFNRRFDHNFSAVKQEILQGTVGDVHIVKITSRDPSTPPLAYVKNSGGIYADMMVHDFDMARFLTGSEVEEVYAAASVRIDEEIGMAGDFDTATAVLRFKDSSIALIDNSRQAVYGYDQRLEVFGSKGALHIRNDTPSTMVVSNTDGVIAEKPKYLFLDRYMDSFTEEKVQFFEAIRNDTPVPVGGRDGLLSVVIAEAANVSVKENRPVRVAEIL